MNTKEKGVYLEKAIRLLDDNKKLYLLCEYLKIKDHKKAPELPSDIEDIIQSISEDNERLLSLIKKEMSNPAADIKERVQNLKEKDFCDNILSVNYDVYTSEVYHNSFWNEIPLPVITEDFFLAVRTALSFNFGKFCVDIYDMSDKSVLFKSKEEMESVLDNADIAPFTTFQKDGDKWEELYSA